MPEGHTIHRIARDHRRDFVGQRIKLSSPQGRFEEGAEILNGRTLQEVEAHGKHLCYGWSGGRRLHIHLGLYGKFRRHKTPPPEPRGQVRLRAVGDNKAFDLNGPTACEVITKNDWAAIQTRLGPDPLRDDADIERVWERIHKSRAAIGTLLLNQAVIAGVGNVYRSEVLHLLRMNPDTPGNAISREQFDLLWQQISSLLKIGVKYNRIIVADPKDVGKPRSRMNRSERLLVYKRDRCIQCDAPIDSWILGARRVFACTKCQPR
ncbi:MAG: DNA-formamidopyrimidine glycosylase family protein [Pirellulaceae bacterium]|nr:DNA-formamidopyrimidine glycosylase family protein [Pirellulaceae bacterium]